MAVEQDILKKLKTEKTETTATTKKTADSLPKDKKEKKLLIPVGQTAFDYFNYLNKNWGKNSEEYKTKNMAIKPFNWERYLKEQDTKYTKYAITNPKTVKKLIDYITDLMYKNHTYFNGKINYEIKTNITKAIVEDMQKNNSILPENKDHYSTKQKITNTIMALNNLQVAVPENENGTDFDCPHLFVLGYKNGKTTGQFYIKLSKDSEKFWLNYFKPFLPLQEELRRLVGNDYIFTELVYRLINLDDREITNKEIIDIINIDLNKVGKNPKERLKMPIDKLIDSFNEMHKNKTIHINKNEIWQDIKIKKGYKLTDTKDKFIKAKNTIEFTKVEKAEESQK